MAVGVAVGLSVGGCLLRWSCLLVCVEVEVDEEEEVARKEEASEESSILAASAVPVVGEVQVREGVSEVLVGCGAVRSYYPSGKGTRDALPP